MTLNFHLHTATLLFLQSFSVFGQNHRLSRGGILRLLVGVGVGKILPTPTPTPTPDKTVDSDRLQLRSRLRLRGPGRHYIKCTKTHMRATMRTRSWTIGRPCIKLFTDSIYHGFKRSLLVVFFAGPTIVLACNCHHQSNSINTNSRGGSPM